MPKTYIISDEHYFHENIIHYCNRPYKTTKEFQADMIKRHNETVEPGSTVYHLGDFALTDNWKKLAAILNKLNGNHHLIVGNHDWMYIWNYVDAGFISVHTSFILEDKYNLIHDPSAACGLKDMFWIHGHLHNNTISADNCFNACVEVNDYRPVDFEQIKQYFLNK